MSLSGIWAKLIALGGFLLAIGLGLLKVFNTGRDLERGKHEKAEAEDRAESAEAILKAQEENEDEKSSLPFARHMLRVPKFMRKPNDK